MKFFLNCPVPVPGPARPISGYMHVPSKGMDSVRRMGFSMMVGSSCSDNLSDFSIRPD